MTTDTPAQHLRSALEPCDLGKCLFCGVNLRWQTDDIDGWIAHLYCVGCDFLGPISDFKYEDVEEAKIDSWNRWSKGIAALAQPAENAKDGEVVAWIGPIPHNGEGKPDWVPDDAIVMLAFNPVDAQNSMTWEFAAKRKAPAKGMDWEAATAFCIEMPLAHPPAAEPVGLLRETLDQCMKQFAFYATEHAKAGKTEKAATNQRFADLCHAALATPARTDDPAREADWRGRMVRLDACPVGLFWSGGVLCVKTEYRTEKGAIEAYIVSSGEFFWGKKPQTVESQAASMVVPVDIEFAERVLDVTADEIAARTDDAGQPSGDVAAMREAAAKVADIWVRADYSEECNILADSIAQEIRALPLPTGKQSLQVADKAAGAGALEDIARAIHESDPDVGCTWAEWVAYAEAHPDHMQAVDYVRRQARAVASLPPAAHADVRDAGQFLLDRLVDHEVRMTSEDDAREWSGHVTPAMARFRAALSTPPAALDEGDK